MQLDPMDLEIQGSVPLQTQWISGSRAEYLSRPIGSPGPGLSTLAHPVDL
uniref:Uncharacterized protein n=1 Tax=Anguilla anguilla TaxID=7936 RepID=A0A0E9WLN5_ANGAN